MGSRFGLIGRISGGLILAAILTSVGTAIATTPANAQAGIVLASDDFNRPDELPLVVGGSWQQAAGGGSTNLVGNQVVGAVSEAVYFWQGPGTFDDTRQYARARVVQTTGQVGLALLGGSGQALVAAWDQSIATLYIYWYVGGAYQGNLTTAPSTVQAGDVIEAQLLNGTIYAKLNGTVVASVANTTALTSGRPGFETFRAGGILDDWEAGTPPSYSLSGTIIESAVGLSGVLVSASGGFGGSAVTDANGAYRIEGPFGWLLLVVALLATAVVVAPAGRRSQSRRSS